MLISAKHGFGFVCVPKCGSTTIEVRIRKHCDVRLSGMPTVKHVKYSEIEAHLLPLLALRKVERPYMFAAMRDPADWIISWYTYRSRPPSETRKPTGPKRTVISDVSLLEFTEEYCSPKPRGFARVGRQSDWLTAADGSIGLDEVIPLHMVDTRLPQLIAERGVSIPDQAKRLNTSPKRAIPDDERRQVSDRLRAFIPEEFELYEGFVARTPAAG